MRREFVFGASLDSNIMNMIVEGIKLNMPINPVNISTYEEIADHKQFLNYNILEIRKTMLADHNFVRLAKFYNAVVPDSRIIVTNIPTDSGYLYSIGDENEGIGTFFGIKNNEYELMDLSIISYTQLETIKYELRELRLPTEPIRISVCEIVVDASKFIDDSIAHIEKHMRMDNVFLRLICFKGILEVLNMD